MVIQKSEKKSTGGTSASKIGFFKGSLIACNPNAEVVKKLYNIEGDIEAPVYQGTDKNQVDWALVRFILQEELSKDPIEFKVFIKKEVSEWDNAEKEHKIEFINQWGDTQVVDEEKHLFKNFTHVQRWDKDSSAWTDVMDENGQPMEKQYRKAWKGEAEIYALLKKLVNVDWFTATNETNLFIKFDDLMRGKVSEITSMIGSDSIQSVVGMIEITPKDGDNGVVHYSNCIGRAWMPGFRIAQCNLMTQNNQWTTLDSEEAKKNKKLYDIRNFYYWCNKSKNIVAYRPYGTFDPSTALNATDATISHSEPVADTDY